jgi:hypothetical protein
VDIPNGAETAADRAKRLAEALIGVRRAPVGWEIVRRLATEAEAYFSLTPYPWHHFSEWMTEERGPYPCCMPFGRTSVQRSARWLFGKPVQINAGPQPERGEKIDNPLEDWLRKAWQANRMPTRMKAGATRGGFQGGMALKFSYDKTAEVPLSFQTLSAEHVRGYYDPHNRDRLLMVRIQYPFQDPQTGAWMLFREEWTAQEHVSYAPIPANLVPTGISTPQGYAAGVPYFVAADRELPDVSGAWRDPSRKENPFGLIPVTLIKNLDPDDCHGIGDLWGLFRAYDRVNLTYHLMDKSNQFDSEPNLIFLDVDIDQAEGDRPSMPGQPRSLKSDEASGGERKQGQVIHSENTGALRPQMMEYAKDLRRQVVAGSGNVEVDPSEFTNKGNLTQAVLSQLYGPLIELTGEKRKTYGEDGICKFLENVCVGLKRSGIRIPELDSVIPDDHNTFDVTLKWPDYFALTEEEKLSVVTRMNTEVSTHLMSHERAVETVAVLEGVDDVADLLEEVKQQQADAEAKDAAQFDKQMALKSAQPAGVVE